jgi:two-component system LytT family response regulator
MNIVIIEDELPASNRLGKMLRQLLPDSKLLCSIDSIAGAQTWFAAHPMPDLVLLDIHLADGSAFDLLQRVSITAPIIFTTAYDQYAVAAFKTNSIDYLLKPVKQEELKAALDKLRDMKKLFTSAPEEHSPRDTDAKPIYKKRFVIRIGEHLKTLAAEDIAYCYSESKMTYARSTDGRNYPMDHNLDALEHMLDPQHFFRINRQYIVSLKAIEEMRAYTKSRVIIRLKPAGKEAPVVSAERSADFKMWLGGEL